jgi:hypothetical protein
LEKKAEAPMASVKTFSLLGLILYLLAIFAPYSYAGEGDTIWQINTPVDEILKPNPLPAGDKTSDDQAGRRRSVSAYLARMASGTRKVWFWY